MSNTGTHTSHGDDGHWRDDVDATVITCHWHDLTDDKRYRHLLSLLFEERPRSGVAQQQNPHHPS